MKGHALVSTVHRVGQLPIKWGRAKYSQPPMKTAPWTAMDGCTAAGTLLVMLS